MSKYMYVIVRSDIPVAAQAVQACHASVGAGREFQPLDDTNLVFLTVSNRAALLWLQQRAHANGIPTSLFFEPDWDYGHTALATAPVGEDKRHIFRNLKLWRPNAVSSCKCGCN